jgi:NADPH:quinone reductase
MVRAVRIHETGGPDVMKLEEIGVGDPGPGQIRIRHTAIGVNFIDTYQRSGLYPVSLPSPLGLEAAGVVEAVGDGVHHLREGDRVAYGTGPLGAYSEAHLVAAGRVAKLPDGVDDRTAAAMMLKGMTAQYLLRQTFRVKKGDTILFHAAAGGVGLIACQWANNLGATVIGTAGSEEKAERARAHGCHHTILYRTENVPDRVREITAGKMVPVVYDGVGKATWEASLDCLAPRGLMVSFGNASGPVGLIDPLILSAKGSLFLTRPTLFHYTMSAEELQAAADDLFSVVLAGAVTIRINQTYALGDVAQAHKALESRRTTGASILFP